MFWKRTTTSVPVLTNNIPTNTTSTSTKSVKTSKPSGIPRSTPTPPLEAIIPPPRPETEKELKPFIRKVLATPHTANIVFDNAYVESSGVSGIKGGSVSNSISSGAGANGKMIIPAPVPTTTLLPTTTPSYNTKVNSNNTVTTTAATNSISVSKQDTAAITSTTNTNGITFQAVIANGNTILSGDSMNTANTSNPQAPSKINHKDKLSHRVKLSLKHLNKSYTSMEELDIVQPPDISTSGSSLLFVQEEDGNEIRVDKTQGGMKRSPSGNMPGNELGIFPVIHISPMKKSYSSDRLHGSGNQSPGLLLNPIDGSPSNMLPVINTKK